jgi:hypothetical protein
MRKNKVFISFIETGGGTLLLQRAGKLLTLSGCRLHPLLSKHTCWNTY